MKRIKDQISEAAKDVNLAKIEMKMALRRNGIQFSHVMPVGISFNRDLYDKEAYTDGLKGEDGVYLFSKKDTNKGGRIAMCKLGRYYYVIS